MIIFVIFLAILCYYVLFLCNDKQHIFPITIYTDSLADKALRCLEVNSKTLTLEETNKCIDIILQSEHETFRLVHYYSKFIPTDRLNECRQRVKSNVL